MRSPVSRAAPLLPAGSPRIVGIVNIRDRLVIDPGLGYFLGSTPGPSLAALAGIRELKDTFGVPDLVSPSRKSFLSAITSEASHA